MFIESVVPQPIPGAARVYDVTWPAKLGVRPIAGTAVGTPGMMGRQSGTAPGVDNSSATQLTGVASAVNWDTVATYLGRGPMVFRPGTGAVGTGAVQQLDAMTILPTYGAAANQSDTSETDDWACWRCFGVLSFQPQPSYAADTGLTWVAQNAGSYEITAGSASGFGFVQTGPQDMSFVLNTTNGVSAPVIRPLITGVNLQPWQSYEVRVIGATPSKNAVVKVFIGGRIKLTLDWVTDLLPNPVASNGVYGFRTCLIAHGAGVGGDNAGFACDYVRFMVGPTEASLL